VHSMTTKIWTSVAGFLILGYLSMGRSFAYFGVPPLKVFIGKVALGAFLLLHTRAVFGRWIAALVKPTPLNGVAWGLFRSCPCRVRVNPQGPSGNLQSSQMA
jgi:hypothetical protein